MRVVVVGGGHASLPLLTSNLGSSISVTLVTPCCHLYYSGMIPQYVAGYYNLDDIRIDLNKLSQSFKFYFIKDFCVSIDTQFKTLKTKGGLQLPYDVLVINSGVTSRKIGGLYENPAFYVKPLEELVRFRSFIEANPASKICIIGGGAAGTEIAMNLASTGKFNISVFEKGNELLQQFDSTVRTKAALYLRNNNVYLRLNHSDIPTGFDCYLIAAGNDSSTKKIDHVLAEDGNHRIFTNDFLQVLEHSNIFAVGDVANVAEKSYSQIGVHAVKQGNVLKNNVISYLTGKKLSAYKPYPVNPLIISMGSNNAILSWPGFSLCGRTSSILKHYLDKSWVQKYKVNEKFKPISLLVESLKRGF